MKTRSNVHPLRARAPGCVFPPIGPEREGARKLGRSGLLGVVAGVVGLGCCVYPVALVLFGLASATEAVALGNRLFTQWGWAFKLAGVAFAGLAVFLQRRRAVCVVGRPRTVRNALILFGAGLVTYGALYAVTTALGRLAPS
jgi:hypothetical protein